MNATKNTENMKTYKDQNQEIQILLKRLSKKSQGFADYNHTSKWYGDLGHVLEELKDLDLFISDKFLKS